VIVSELIEMLLLAPPDAEISTVCDTWPRLVNDGAGLPASVRARIAKKQLDGLNRARRLYDALIADPEVAVLVDQLSGGGGGG
jgi:hypothetical protein